MSSDADTDRVEQLAEHLRLHPDASAGEVIGATGADPSVWLDAVRGALETDTPAETLRNAETTREDTDTEDTNPTPEADKAGSSTPDMDTDTVDAADAGAWAEAGFANPEPDTYPPALLEREKWMGRKAGEKLPFAPWGDADHPDGEDGKDARYKWGISDHYADGETVALAEDDPRLGGRVFIQTESDPFAFVDGDDVRDPDTGEVHPAFVALLEQLGRTYADVSTSGSGVHAYYQGELPLDGHGQAVFDIDTEPWGANESVPTVEIYANKHVCVTTGEHVPGTGLDVVEWDADTLRTVLEANGYTDKEPISHDTDRDRPDLEEYDPVAVDAEEKAEDVKDVLAAVERLTPRDLPLRTRRTGTDSTGWSTWDPSYRSSESGESLHSPADEPVFHDHKQGESFGLLGLFAAEQGIITDPWDRLEGAEWWEAVDAARDAGAPIPEYDAAQDAEPVAPLALAKLDAINPNARRRAAKKRGLEIPSTEDARDRLRDAVFREIGAGNTTVLDAPTALGKSYTAATEPWRRRDSTTGGAPVIHLHQTRDARDDALKATQEDGGAGAVLRGRKEASPLARGDHDPVEDPDAEDAPDQVVTIDGEPASEWFDTMCDGRHLPFSTALALARDRNDQGLDELPPFGQEDPAVAQWDGLPRDDDGEPAVDVIHATHQFAYVPSLRTHTNLILDEEPDFTLELGGEEKRQDRVRRMVNAYLQQINAPVTNFEDFVTLAEYDGTGGDAAKERDALESALDTDRTPPTEWYVENADAHAIAPDLTRALWNALRWEEPNQVGRRSAKVYHEPPRFDAEKEGFAAGTWLSVVVDEDHTVQTVRATPDFSQARSVIGLDAHPSMPKWELNGAPGMTKDTVLDATERRLWRRYERGLTVVQVGDAERPRSGPDAREWMNDDRVRAILDALREHYGDGFKTALSTVQTEPALLRLLADVTGESVEDARELLMHYGEEKSRNDFADEDAGYVYGCMDPGDKMILNAITELGLDAKPATVETEDGEEKREKGRTFDGADADTAAALLASVRENHVAQAAGRYARNPTDPESTATVFVHTSAAPAGFVDLEVPGVEWLASDLQREIIGELTERPGASTREIADAVDCTKEHVRKTLARLEEKDLVERDGGAGEHGADVFHDTGADSTLVDLGETTNGRLLVSNRWSLVVWDRHRPESEHTAGAGASSTGADAREDGDPPPTDAD